MLNDKEIYRRGLKHSSLRQRNKWEKKFKLIAQSQGPVRNNPGSSVQEMTLSWASVCMSGWIRSLSGTRHQLYKTIMWERAAAMLWIPEALLQTLQPHSISEQLPLSCNTLFHLLSPLNIFKKMTLGWDAEMPNLAVSKGRFSRAASWCSGIQHPALPTRCPAACCC